MKIRSITVGLSPDVPLRAGKVMAAGKFATRVRGACEAMGIEVQTLRLSTPPFPTYLYKCTDNEVLDFGKDLEACCRDQGFEYCALGPVGFTVPGRERFLELALRLITETSTLFTSAFLTGQGARSSGRATLEIARVIQEIARETDDGFGNLRFAALINCPPHIPFFPAAYHEGADSFAFALEAADVVSSVCGANEAWEMIEEKLQKELERQVFPLQRIGEEFEKSDFVFRGIDLSPAPGPSREASIVYALEGLGFGYFGGPGTLAAAGLITSALKGTELRTCGYCGLMLPVLEDAGLAERNNQGLLRLTNLLAYSAVCGTGLDTIPLPGDVSERELAALLLDVAMLGGKLNKPLSARLLPIPHKRAGEMTEFNFDFFVNTKIMNPL